MARRKSIEKVIGANLRRVRQQLGLSQDDLADRAGLHRTFVSSVERGLSNLSARNIDRLAHALGLEAADLMQRGDNHPPPSRKC